MYVIVTSLDKIKQGANYRVIHEFADGRACVEVDSAADCLVCETVRDDDPVLTSHLAWFERYRCGRCRKSWKATTEKQKTKCPFCSDTKRVQLVGAPERKVRGQEEPERTPEGAIHLDPTCRKCGKSGGMELAARDGHVYMRCRLCGDEQVVQ